MNDRQNRIVKLKKYFVYECAEDGGAEQLTSFDKEVLAVLDKLFDDHRDVTVTPECASLGFVLKSDVEGTERSHVDPCCTVPCWGGKMPYQKDETNCALGISMGGVCNESPMQRVKDLVVHKKLETNDES